VRVVASETFVIFAISGNDPNQLFTGGLECEGPSKVRQCSLQITLEGGRSLGTDGYR
jgi:hypothetical protein